MKIFMRIIAGSFVALALVVLLLVISLHIIFTNKRISQIMVRSVNKAFGNTTNTVNVVWGLFPTPYITAKVEVDGAPWSTHKAFFTGEIDAYLDIWYLIWDRKLRVSRTVIKNPVTTIEVKESAKGRLEFNFPKRSYKSSYNNDMTRKTKNSVRKSSYSSLGNHNNNYKVHAFSQAIILKNVSSNYLSPITQKPERNPRDFHDVKYASNAVSGVVNQETLDLLSNNLRSLKIINGTVYYSDLSIHKKTVYKNIYTSLSLMNKSGRASFSYRYRNENKVSSLSILSDNLMSVLKNKRDKILITHTVRDIDTSQKSSVLFRGYINLKNFRKNNGDDKFLSMTYTVKLPSIRFLFSSSELRLMKSYAQKEHSRFLLELLDSKFAHSYIGGSTKIVGYGKTLKISDRNAPFFFGPSKDPNEAYTRLLFDFVYAINKKYLKSFIKIDGVDIKYFYPTRQTVKKKMHNGANTTFSLKKQSPALEKICKDGWGERNLLSHYDNGLTSFLSKTDITIEINRLKIHDLLALQDHKIHIKQNGSKIFVKDIVSLNSIPSSSYAKKPKGSYVFQLNLEQRKQKNKKQIFLRLRHDIQNAKIEDFFASLGTDVTGALESHADIRTHGQTDRDMIRNLKGQYEFSLRNSRINSGFFSEILGKVSQRLHFKDVKVFDTVRGTFIVRNGIATSDNLLLKNSNFHALGSGYLNIVSRMVDLKFNTDMLAKNKKIHLPVLIYGSFCNPLIKVDTSALSKKITANIIKRVKNKLHGYFK